MAHFPTAKPTHNYANVTIPNGGNVLSSHAVNTTLSAAWSSSINSGKVKISDSDIEIDGLSLKKTLEAVSQRLAIMVPNPELEREFEELRACGDRYRELEREFAEQLKMWNTLKSTDK